MKNEDKIIEIAKLDGFELVSYEDLGYPPNFPTSGRKQFWRKIGEKEAFMELPPYLASRDAIISVIEKQSKYTQQTVVEYFRQVGAGEHSNMVIILTATPSQLAEALLRACGKWKD
jgi:hypothetical protein